ncbi:amidohydrolase family protein [Acuticoccus mangrovi]|uniref:Amidohydrolase family protein n=1 Tax=Acuticoccus mangrovi TaxID=2796142 RepID=A0A934MLJ5_9HYPH|nr:amidohydrolase family protein [Acuticoccus mangrovi]MBJ3776429.1 amidohydrolase family protein [Acuticoccus mangrovi]
MPLFIKDATLLPVGGPGGLTPATGSMRVVGNSIAAIGAGLTPEPGDTIVDGTDRLVMPGLVNSHIHSSEGLFKGRYDNLPLELWMLLAYPIVGASAASERLVYLRTMLSAAEGLRTGSTCHTDDIYEAPKQDIGRLAAVFHAYRDVGMRATISGHVMDKPFLDTIPFAREIVPADLQAECDAVAVPAVADYMAFAREAFAKLHGMEGRLNFMMAPSAPQRCTAEMFQAIDELARSNGTPLHTHIVETKLQAITGPVMYGKTLVEHMKAIGVLHDGVTIAHSIWVTDDDIRLLGEARASIVHNILSNLKLGSGLAPVKRQLEAGVNVALGSDGVSTADAPRMFDVVKAAGLTHKIGTPDYTRWLTAGEVLTAATLGGARSARLGDVTGSLEVGKRADFLVLDMRTANFTPLNDILNHLVYSENGSSIEAVYVDGEKVMEHGTLTRVNEAELLAELRQIVPEYLARHARTEIDNERMMDFFAAIHRRAAETDIGMHRLGTEPAFR